MALIQCPECGKEVSSLAKSCPNCGCPICQEEELNNNIEKQPPFPELPAILNVGSQITNWSFDAAFDGSYFHSVNVIHTIPEGDVKVVLHTNGICIYKALTFYYISSQQIVNMTITTQEKIVTENKSVIGRAVVGGLLLGPLAAVVGGISGIGTKQKLKGKYYLVVNFWDVNSRQLQTILICTKQLINSFVDRYNKEKEKNNIPQGSNIVANIFNDDLSLNPDRVAEAVKSVSPVTLYQQIQNATGCTLGDAKQKIEDIIQQKGINKSDIKNSGCMVTLLLLLSSSLLSLFLLC